MGTTIDCNKLRALFAERGFRQIELANKIGVNRYNFNRWLRRGEVASIKMVNIEKMAGCLGMGVEEFLRRVAIGADQPPAAGEASMSAAEKEWLVLYRKLTPLDQAKARLAMEEIVQRADAVKKEGRKKASRPLAKK